MSFRPTVGDRMIDLLKAQFGETFHYFYGDPVAIPVSQLPALIIEHTDTGTDPAPTGMERLHHTILVKLALNKKDDFNKKPDEVVCQRLLEQYTEGIDADTSQYAEQTIVGVLRRNFTLQQTVNDQELTIRYLLQPRPQNLLTAEAEVTVTVQEDVMLPARQ